MALTMKPDASKMGNRGRRKALRAGWMAGGRPCLHGLDDEAGRLEDGAGGSLVQHLGRHFPDLCLEEVEVPDLFLEALLGPGPLGLGLDVLALLLVPEVGGGHAAPGLLLHALALLLLQPMVHRLDVDRLGAVPQPPAAATRGRGHVGDQLLQVLGLGHDYPGQGLPLPQGAVHLRPFPGLLGGGATALSH